MAVRRAVARAAEWNADHPAAITPRLDDANAYRVVAVRANVVDLVTVTSPVAQTGAPQAATLILAMDLSSVLDVLNQQPQR